MSVKVMALIWDLDLPTELKMTALALADHASHDGTGARPGLGLLAKKTGLSSRTVSRHLTRLREAGWIEATAYAQGGHGKATEYRFTTPLMSRFPDRNHVTSVQVPEKEPRRLTTRTTSFDDKNLDPDDTYHVTGDVPTIRTVIEPSDPSIASTSDAPTSITNILPDIIPPTPNGPLTVKQQRTVLKDGLAAAMVAVEGWDPNSITGAQWASMEKPAQDLARLDPVPDAAAILRAARIYKAKEIAPRCTPTALVKHWPACQQLPSESPAAIRHEVSKARMSRAILKGEP